MAAAEIQRRLVHAGGALPPAAYLLGVLTWSELRVLYLAGTALAIGLEFLRLVVGLEWRLFDRLTRAYERSNPAGYALYTVSSAAVVLAAEPRIAVPAVLMLALGDPVSGLLTRDDRGIDEPKRPLAVGAMFAVCGLIAAPFVPLPAAILGALVAAAADGLTPVVAGYVIDDNVTIPIGAAVAMWLGVAVLSSVGL